MTTEELNELERAAKAVANHCGPYSELSDKRMSLGSCYSEILRLITAARENAELQKRVPTPDEVREAIRNFDDGIESQRDSLILKNYAEAAARENAALRERVKELEQKIEDEENAAWDRNTRE